MLTGDPTLASAGFLTARCAGPGRYYSIVEAVFAEYPSMAAGSETVYEGLMKGGKAGGLSEAQVNACLKDTRAIAALQARERRAEADGVSGTPTFVVAGVTLDGEHTLEVLSAAVEKALKRGRR
jgi:predicted DsbA family dithiol-disulfide isomerase